MSQSSASNAQRSRLTALAQRTSHAAGCREHYTRAYREYCWPVSSLDDLKLAPFHLLASEGAVHTDKAHTWHMEVIGRLCAADTEVLLPRHFKLSILRTRRAPTTPSPGGPR